MEHQQQLKQWQSHLQQVLFYFCQELQPSIITKHKWPCYSAAELPCIADAVSRFCMDEKVEITRRKITGEQRESFLVDLRLCRLIRHAVAHCENVSATKMEKLAACACRIMAIVKRLLRPQYDAEITAVVSHWVLKSGILY